MVTIPRIWLRGPSSGLAQFVPKIGKPVEVENLFGDVNNLITINVRSHFQSTRSVTIQFSLKQILFSIHGYFDIHTSIINIIFVFTVVNKYI